ncbi:hypothetical protein NE237_010734 [Protea cynaroides]|uniref:Uncharacterized protein n=1 Tax=Protea cynaroides TaxID=273540 RepID=A0A9Q0L0A2_9MAGN|nr:hypothetical protein NE237_010734 [Protea cynaroides]
MLESRETKIERDSFDFGFQPWKSKETKIDEKNEEQRRRRLSRTHLLLLLLVSAKPLILFSLVAEGGNEEDLWRTTFADLWKGETKKKICGEPPFADLWKGETSYPFD